MALGLGEMQLESFLNEPLQARVDLLNTGGLHEDEIRIRLATREDFEKMGVERAYFLTGIQFDVQVDDRGRARIIMTSEDPVLEPYLDFIIEARWPSGRLLREYTVLVDPPVFDQSSPVISASERVAVVEGDDTPATETPDQAAAASSGTRVEVKKSGLAPGEMPRRDYSAQTAPTPAPGSRYMIRRDETLWEIASKAKPQGTSVHQMMLDIQRLNPDAFIDGNINRVKAGYIVYLPDSDDISSADLASAMAEVRQQNEDWRAGRASAGAASAGPSLRISADTDAAADTAPAAAAGAQSATAAAALEDLEKAQLEGAEMAERLAAMEQQLATLQRIVSLKDDQIAALQNALSKSGDAQDAEPGLLEAPGGDERFARDSDARAAAAATGEGAAGSAARPVAAAPPAAQPVEREKPATSPTPAAASDDGVMTYVWLALGALLLALLGFVFMRRRGATHEDATLAAEPIEDVFADVELKEQTLELETPDAPTVVAASAQAEPAPDAQRDNRGYGERRHDEYASDVDAGDALAEADIYIAYGRYPQAVDLLKNATVNEPTNPDYRLKMVELYTQMGDRAAAREQIDELRAIGDAASLARAEDILRGTGDGSADHRAATAATTDLPDMDTDERIVDLDATETALEGEFSGLEIEGDAVAQDDDTEELDLSADFDGGSFLSDDDDEELVIAAESSGLATKLDLARAYLDMGDEDGARQILEEVAAEGNEELQAEARTLLDRIA